MFERSEFVGGGSGGRVWSPPVHGSGVADDAKRGLSGGTLREIPCLNVVSYRVRGPGGGVWSWVVRGSGVADFLK